MSSMTEWLYTKDMPDAVTVDIEAEVRETVYFLEILIYRT